jgi:twitching motility protein PilT
MTIQAWVKKGRDLGASDVHLEAGTAPVARVRGELRAIGEPMPPADVEQISRALMSAEAWEKFAARGSADISVAAGGSRCRINVYRTIRGTAVAIRLLNPAVNGLRACNLHPQLAKFVEASTGLVLISGPTG